MSSLLVVEAGSISLDFPMDSLGLDSLIAIELKTWITRTFHAAMQTSEILDTPNLRTLVAVAARKSTLSNLSHEALPNGKDRRSSAHDQANGASRLLDKDPSSTQLSPFPLQDLKSTLEFYLYSVQAFCSTAEFRSLSDAVKDFQSPGGLGQILQGRLQKRANDPQKDEWLYDLYTDHVYLKQRTPINPWGTFFGCHKNGPMTHTQSERAAIICLAALECKQDIEEGRVEQQKLNSQPLCMDSLQWLFNSYREPCLEVDKVHKPSKDNYIVAMRKGHFFKISLANQGESIPITSLIVIFEAILAKDLEKTPLVAALTADNRNTWAEVRTIVKDASPANELLMNIIEAASFMICLDEASPTTSTERANHFMWGEMANRWSDKLLQFAVCANGVSSYIVEHAVLDASTLGKVAGPIKLAVEAYQPEKVPQKVKNYDLHGDIEQYSFTSNSEIDHHIARVQQKYMTDAPQTDFLHHTCTLLGSKFFRNHSCAPSSGIQLIIQLASLNYFNYLNPSWETIGMRPFHKGRVELVQAILPPVAEFCNAMRDPSVPKPERRELFYSAAKAYTSAVNRISRGRGYMLHLYALQEVCMEGEVVPWLAEGSVYRKTRPGKIMTDSSNWEDAITEGAYPMPDKEHVWIHYEVLDEE